MAAPPTMGIVATLKDAFRTVSGIIGGIMLVILLAMVVIVPFYAPFDVVQAWGQATAWVDNPRVAAPEWSDVFVQGTLPRTLTLNEPDFAKTKVTSETFGITTIILRESFDFTADYFPSELTFRLFASFGNVSPLVSIQLERPDGETVELIRTTPDKRAPTANNYPFSQTFTVPETLRNVRAWATTTFNATDVAFPKPEVTLFAQGGEDMLDPQRARLLKGEYGVRVIAVAFNEADDIDGRFLVFGRVFGLAGTDHLRRDLMTGILWGAPVALAFGTVAALIVILTQTLFGALSGWYGGRTDEAVQRASDFFLIIPILPILILIGIFYRPGIWAILFVVVSFSLVGGTTKVIRSIVLQVKQEQYVESATSYGASKLRILFKHIFPRVMPYTFALIALAVPAYIFLEASLAFLGLSDPTIPTWGSLLGTAYANNAMFNGFWWWIALPAAGIIFATIAFALLGYSFDKVLNPRLREQ
ncbi:MAG: ABC transporter permease [Thermoplasmata archaeon]|nr:ABC transporter permease [Thermoplasmata archaeon]